MTSTKLNCTYERTKRNISTLTQPIATQIKSRCLPHEAMYVSADIYLRRVETMAATEIEIVKCVSYFV